MSDRLISLQAAIDALCKRCDLVADEDVPCTEKCNDIKILEMLPTAQPEIIRCKDCKHRPFDSEDTQGFGVEFPDEKCPCQCEDGWYNWRPNNEWFCGNAERRTDEQ